MGVPKRLTDMQKKFVELLVYGDPKTGDPLNQTEAAKQAGYSHNNARYEASQLCNEKTSPLVVAYKEQLEEEKLQKHEITYTKHLARLDKLGNKAEKKGNYQSAIRAEELRGKAGGIYVNQVLTKSVDADIEEDREAIKRFEDFATRRNRLKHIESNHPLMQKKKD